MTPRYNIPQLRRVYGRLSPPDSDAILELRLWRVRADSLMAGGRVIDALLMIAAVSDLTLAYRRSRALVLSDADRGTLHEIVAVAGVFDVG